MALSLPSFVAVDWGTSSFRLWVLDQGGEVLHHTSGPFGMGTLSPNEYSEVLESHLATFGVVDTVPVVICGMAGSAQGWVNAPYLSIGSDLAILAQNAVRVPHHTRDIRILPGLKQLAPVNVMRGEETQILGLLAQAPNFDGVVGLPGTHTKWVHLRDGRVQDFATCMTGELFSVLSKHTVLRHSMEQDGWNDAAFALAAAMTLDTPERIATKLFDLRAGMLLTDLNSADARSQLSGMLIGLEMSATRDYWQNGRVVLIGVPDLCRKYSAALGGQGVTPEILDAETMTLAGLSLAYRSIKENESGT